MTESFLAFGHIPIVFYLSLLEILRMTGGLPFSFIDQTSNMTTLILNAYAQTHGTVDWVTVADRVWKATTSQLTALDTPRITSLTTSASSVYINDTKLLQVVFSAD